MEKPDCGTLSILTYSNFSFPLACAAGDTNEPVDNLDQTKDSFDGANRQEEGKQHSVPEDDVLRLFANAPRRLVKQIIVSTKEKLNWVLLETLYFNHWT